MNNIEFIDKLIKQEQFAIKTYEELFKTDKTEFDKQITKGYIQIHQKNINNLQQIKAELEAWYVVKEELQITVKSKNPYGEPLRRYELNVIGQNKIDTLNKALEVEDE